MIKFWLHKVAAGRDIMKIKTLAEMTKLSPTTVSGIWNNDTLRIDCATLNTLCRVLNCQVSDLIEYLPDEPKKTKK